MLTVVNNIVYLEVAENSNKSNMWKIMSAISVNYSGIRFIIFINIETLCCVPKVNMLYIYVLQLTKTGG